MVPPAEAPDTQEGECKSGVRGDLDLDGSCQSATAAASSGAETEALLVAASGPALLATWPSALREAVVPLQP